MAKSELSLPQYQLLRAGAVIGLASLTVFVGWVLFGLNFDGGYAVGVKALSVILYLLAVPGFIRVSVGRSKSRTLLIAVGVLTVIAVLVLAMLAFGYMQDAAGARCADISGWNREPCIGATTFWLLYYGFLPGVFVPGVLLALLALAYGLIEDSRLSRKMPTKRRRS